MRHFVLHVRLTKRCNADCAYCSSWSRAAEAMTPEAYAKALDFLVEGVFPRIGVGGGHVSVQYVGGELLTIPPPVLAECVETARARLAAVFDSVRDGAQSNLIGSAARVVALDALFGGRLGSSVDSFGAARTVKGSPELYREMADASRAELRRRRKTAPSSIFVVDAAGLPRVPDEIARAEEGGYGLVLRPVFRGGKDVAAAAPEDIAAAFAAAFEAWAMRSTVSVEPFSHLLAARLRSVGADAALPDYVDAGCPFQENCAEVSLDLEPDGTLYVCLDMADSGQHPLGNALEGRFDAAAWQALADRRRVAEGCRACRWFRECRGGCMSEAVHATGSPYGKTALCGVWKALFSKIDSLLEARGAVAVAAWVLGLRG
jgi:radical SAM protein with 4Fe4S-binding SPASM domain